MGLQATRAHSHVRHQYTPSSRCLSDTWWHPECAKNVPDAAMSYVHEFEYTHLEVYTYLLNFRTSGTFRMPPGGRRGARAAATGVPYSYATFVFWHLSLMQRGVKKDHV